MCEIVQFYEYKVKSIIYNNKRMYYPNDLWSHMSGISVDRFERYLRLPETEELLRNLSGNPNIYTQHEDNATLHIDGVIMCLITQMYKDDWTEEFIVSEELLTDYYIYLGPPVKMPMPKLDLGCGC